MSFILDALKRSENERQRTVGPSLADAPIRRIRPERPWWAFAVAALLVINLGVLVVVLTRNHASPQQAAAPAAIAPPPQVATSSAPPVQAPPMQQAAQPAMEPAEPVLPSPAVQRPQTNPAVRSLAEEAATGDMNENLDPRISAAIAAARSGPPAVRPIQPPSVQPLPAASGSSAATFKSVTSPTAAARQNEEVLPSAADLAAGGTSIPELKLDIHVFSANPADRFVFVNMRKYLEGQTLQEGPTVERITTDGVILNQRGLRYVLPRQ
jgi:general secretion pathway protein B